VISDAPEAPDPQTGFARPFNVVSSERSCTYYAAEFPCGRVFAVIGMDGYVVEHGMVLYRDREAVIQEAGDGYQLIEPPVDS
jgi:hypothetical protein